MSSFASSIWLPKSLLELCVIHYFTKIYYTNFKIPEDYELYRDSLLLMAESDFLIDEQSFQPYSFLITISKIKRGIMVFTTPFSQQHEILLDKMVDSITENSLFYVVYQESSTNQTKYKQAITIRTAPFGVTNPIKLNQFGHIIENYDLKVEGPKRH